MVKIYIHPARLKLNISYSGVHLRPGRQLDMEKRMVLVLGGLVSISQLSDVPQGTVTVGLSHSRRKTRNQARGFKITHSDETHVHGILCLKHASFLVNMTTNVPRLANGHKWHELLRSAERKSSLEGQSSRDPEFFFERELVEGLETQFKQSLLEKLRNAQAYNASKLSKDPDELDLSDMTFNSRFRNSRPALRARSPRKEKHRWKWDGHIVEWSPKAKTS